MTTRSQTLVHPVDRLLGETPPAAASPATPGPTTPAYDATVPQWRFERVGADAVAGALSGWYAMPIVVENVVRRPLPGGEAVELDLSWVEDGVPHAAHQVHLLDLDGDRIAADTVFCGGRWSASLLAEMEAARVQ